MGLDQETFWRAICKSPDDDTPRLVFADWLEDFGYTPRVRAKIDRSNPLALGQARAEFIRAQCELVRLPPGDPKHTHLEVQVHDLESAYREAWLCELPQWLTRSHFHRDHIAFRRGFPSTISHGTIAYTSHARGFASRSVIDEIELNNLKQEEVARVAVCQHLPRLRRLILQGRAASLLLPILSAPGLTGLTHLKLTDPGHGDPHPVRSFAEVLAAPSVRGLTSLSLSFPAEYRASDFDSMMNHLGDAALDQLTQLDLICKPDEANHWPAILRGSFVPRLSELLINTSPTPEAFEVIADTDRLAGLKSLLIQLPKRQHGATAPEDGARILAESKHLPNLQALQLHHCTDEALRHLGDSPLLLDRLTELNICFSTYSNGGITAAGWKTLAASGRLGKLSRLELTTVALTDEGLRALSDSPNLPSLSCLRLRNNDLITEEGLAALAESPNLPALEVVWIGSNVVGKSEEKFRRLQQRFAGRFLVR